MSATLAALAKTASARLEVAKREMAERSSFIRRFLSENSAAQEGVLCLRARAKCNRREGRLTFVNAGCAAVEFCPQPKTPLLTQNARSGAPGRSANIENSVFEILWLHLCCGCGRLRRSRMRDLTGRQRRFQIPLAHRTPRGQRVYEMAKNRTLRVRTDLHDESRDEKLATDKIIVTRKSAHRTSVFLIVSDWFF
jgi:hypothetical protein